MLLRRRKKKQTALYNIPRRKNYAAGYQNRIHTMFLVHKKCRLSDLRGVVLLDVAKNSDVVGLDKVDGDTLAAETTRTTDAVNVQLTIADKGEKKSSLGLLNCSATYQCATRKSVASRNDDEPFRVTKCKEARRQRRMKRA